ncbi:MAG: ABC transporter permease [Acidobacteriota bacterium]
MIASYLKLAWRVLGRRKLFTAISLFGIAFTLVVLMVVAAMLDHVFGPHAPEVNQRRTLTVSLLRMSGEHRIHTGGPGYGLLDRFVRPLPGVERVSLYSNPFTVVGFPGGQRVKSFMKRTDGAFWQVFRFDFVEGGPYTEDDVTQARLVAVINEATRAAHLLGGSAVGRTIEVDGQRFTVTGVVKNVPMLRFQPFADIWVPTSTSKSDAYKREFAGDYNAVVAASRSDFPRIKAEVASRLKAAEKELPDPRSYAHLDGGADTTLEMVSRLILSPTLEESHPGELLGILIAAAFLFMSLPALNLVNLNVSRILERASEIGVRKAFGASTLTLTGQFLVENLVLSLLGGALGLVGATIALGAIEATGVIPYADFRFNPRIFAYGLAATMAFGVVSGVYPALRMSRLHPVAALRSR